MQDALDNALSLADVVAALNVGIQAHDEHEAVTYFLLRDGRTLALWDGGDEYGIYWKWLPDLLEVAAGPA